MGYQNQEVAITNQRTLNIALRVSEANNLNEVVITGDVYKRQAQYFVSLGYYSENGLFKTSDANSYNTNFKYNRYLITSKAVSYTHLDAGRLTPLYKLQIGLSAQA